LTGLETRNYLVSAIVSVYEAEEFLEGCLEDLLAQTIADRIEILVIDSASPQKEGEIVRTYRERHPGIRYLRTPRRETIYAAWNRGVRMATAPYLTSANADDRHRKDALEILVRSLEEHPEAVLAYAPYYETSRKNDTWESGSPKKLVPAPEFRKDLLLTRCFVGSQPVWRRSLHEDLGGFDDRLAIAGDFEFWLRAAERYRFVRVPEVLGLYYVSPEGANAAARDRTRNREETASVQDRYLRRYLGRLDPPVTVVYLGDREEKEWRGIFSGLRTHPFFPSDVAVVTTAPGDAKTGWEQSGGAPDALRVDPRFSPELCAALKGEYAVIVPRGTMCPPDVLMETVEEVDEAGYRAGFGVGPSGEVRCRVIRKDLLRMAVSADPPDFAGNDGSAIPLPHGVDALEVSRRHWHPLRTGLSREIRLCELDAIAYAARKGKTRGVPLSLVRGELRFWKELLLKGGWKAGADGWERSALRGLADFLKGLYSPGRQDG
jgi:glycosyltransferase involved in cell wall biosynthesis